VSGHVFHPGHQELHGVTVVVRGRDGQTFLGRFHEQNSRGVLLHDVAVHHPASIPEAVPQWLDRQRKFGVKVTAKTILVPTDQAESIERFGDT
jgi:hypothetical protein